MIGLNLEKRNNMIIKIQYNRDITCDEIFGVLENIEIYDYKVIETIKLACDGKYEGYGSAKREILYYLAGRMSLPVNTIVQAWYLDEDENWREIFDFRKMWKAVKEREENNMKKPESWEESMRMFDIMTTNP